MKTTKLLVLFSLLLATRLEATDPQPQERPQARLGVLISLDQFRADYLTRFRPWFTEGGFKRLSDEGLRFTECRLHHALTATAPGHAAISTGVYACENGIVANEWAGPAPRLLVGAVEDRNVVTLGLDKPGDKSCSPHRLLAPTIGDELKRQTHGRAKVFAISNKDRAAILMAGRRADAAYWMEQGRFVSSSHYMTTLPPWVLHFNAQDLVRKDFGKSWERLFDGELYDKLQGPDAAEGEESRLGLGITFPHPLTGGETSPGKLFYDAHRLSPFSSALLVDFACELVAREDLGKDSTPDMLCLGFSQTDYCGHSFGPDSHEIMDSVLRLDRYLASLFERLDSLLGRENYFVVLSSDHGVSPLPEQHRLKSPTDNAARFDQAGLELCIQKVMTEKHGAPLNGLPWSFRSAHGYHLCRDALPPGLPAHEALHTLAQALASWPQFAAVYSREQILSKDTPETPLLAKIRRGYHTERSQDVVFVLKPFVVDRTPAGTNHGSPYPCDDHVPLLVWRSNQEARIIHDQVWTEDICPSFCELLGIAPPERARGRNLLGPAGR